MAKSIGIDGHNLLAALYGSQAPPDLKHLESVEILRNVWVQQYTIQNGSITWRTPKTTGMPPHRHLIQSPFDVEARTSCKRQTFWTGYAVHLTETCDREWPNLITNVETTPATTHDGDLTQKIHENLAQNNLLPKEHLLDTNYVDAEHLARSSQEYQVDLVGKVTPDTSWQFKAGEGFDMSCFSVDWDKQRVRCPQGNWSSAWKERTDEYNNPVIEVRFSKATCSACPVRQKCTRAKSEPRLLRLRYRPAYEALQKARERQMTEEFKKKYAIRAGIEGTISQAVRVCNMRRSRYRGLAKTHLQHLAEAVAINLIRLMAWWSEVPKARTRTSSFAALASEI